MILERTYWLILVILCCCYSIVAQGNEICASTPASQEIYDCNSDSISTCQGAQLFFDLDMYAQFTPIEYEIRSGTITYPLKAMTPEGGNVYSLILPDGLISGTIILIFAAEPFCYISFNTEDCAQHLDLPFICDNFDQTGTNWPSDIAHECSSSEWGYYYCQGDTVTGKIINTLGINTSINLQDINVTGAEIININGNQFDFYFPQSGWVNISIKTGLQHNGPDGNIQEEIECHLIYIKPSIEVNINSTYQSENIEICQGETIDFWNTQNLNDYLWRLSDGRDYGGSYAQIDFDTPGSYQLILGDSDPCNCTLADTINITVKSGISPGINCTGTVCLGNSNVYYSEHECDQYIWDISAEGTIVSGGTPDDYFVEVEWTSGVQGLVQLTTPGCIADECRATTSVAIPIINPSGTIEGPDMVCASAVSEYSLPDYSGGEVTWHLDGHGHITTSKFGSRITVQWTDIPFVFDNHEPIIATLEATYNNCLLDCSGMATKQVLIMPNINITGSTRPVCIGSDISLSNNHNKAVNWTIISPSGAINNIWNSATLNYTLNEAGSYRISMNTGNNIYCDNEEVVWIESRALPIRPTEIIGDSIVCNGVLSIYEVVNSEPLEYVKWEIYDGDLSSPSFTTYGNILQYAWLSEGDKLLKAYNYNIRTGCQSESVSFTPVGNNEIIEEIEACKNSILRYTFDEYEKGNTIWTLNPIGAGSIIEQSNTSALVAWDNNNGTLSAKDCRTEKRFIATLVDWPVVVQYQDTICQGELANITVQADDIKGVRVETPFGELISSSTSSDVPPGRYKVFAESLSGCNYFEEIEIIAPNQPNRILRTNAPETICPDVSNNYKLWVENTLVGDTIRWYHNDVLLPETSAELMFVDGGIYRVEVSSADGCYREVQLIIILVCCDTLEAPPTNVYLDTNIVDCYTRSFEIKLPTPGGIYEWEFSDGTTYQGLSYTHTFANYGFHGLKIINKNNCIYVDDTYCGTTVRDTFCEELLYSTGIGLTTKIKHIGHCVGDTSYFEHNTYQYSNANIVSYEWDFDDPASANNTSILENPTHVFTEARPYYINLTVTDSNGCIATDQFVYTPYQYEVEIQAETQVCQLSPIEFNVNSSVNYLAYDWDFGDGLTPDPFISKQSNPTYTYTTPGIYQVIVQTRNNRGCTAADTFSIEVHSSSLSGNIMADRPNPVCAGDEVILTAPLADTYEWSNGANTQQISVNNTGEYRVTISDAYGCEYITPVYAVSYAFGSSVAICGKVKIEQNGIEFYEARKDTLDVCLGDEFMLEATLLPGYQYLWSSGATDNPLAFDPHFNSLGVGTYNYSVDATDNISSCQLTATDYVVRIHPIPEPPVISANNPQPCEGELTILSVQNIQPGMTYQWNNGQIGTSIEVSRRQDYHVTAINSLGCSAISNSITIEGRPSISGWNSGCYEACFPYQLCVFLSDNNSYELWHNGSQLLSLSSTATDITLDMPGDYQLVTRNGLGCTTSSKVLTLDAIPESHQIEGIVFYDENENGIFDAMDELLENIPVSIQLGNTVIMDGQTNSMGAYSFDSLQYNNLEVVIDPSASAYTLFGNIDSLILYDSCFQSKVINFPLISSCENVELSQSHMVCEGDSIQIYGQYYHAQEKDTLTITSEDICDSIIYIDISKAPDIELNIASSKSCETANNGTADITLISGNVALYHLDGDTIDISSQLTGLSSGMHMIEAYDTLGCVYSFPFEIEAFTAPEITLLVDNSCEDNASGSVNINSNVFSGLQYSLDGINYGLANQYTGLAAQDYVLYVKDSNGCIMEHPFTIETLTPPSIDISSNLACNGIADGSIIITNNSSSNLTYSLDANGPFDPNSQIDNLAQGEYQLYILDDQGCTSQMPFMVEELAPLQLDISTLNACPDETNGVLYLLNETLQWSLSSEGPFELQDSITALAQGDYMIYAQDAQGCIDSISFAIGVHNTIPATWTTIYECENLSLGAMVVEPIDNAMYSLDGIQYSNETYFPDLAAGMHTLYVQDQNRCIQEYPFEIGLQAEPAYNISASATCQGDNDGTIQISNLSGQDLQYAIQGSAFDTTTAYSGLASGQYYVHIKYDNCTYLDSVMVPENELPSLSAESSASCASSATGSIIVSKNNASDILIFQEQEYESQNVFENLPHGEYSISVRDANGCEHSIDIPIDTLPRLEVMVQDPSMDCLSDRITISPQIQQSVGNVSYEWSDGSTGSSYSTSASGRHTLMVSDECETRAYEWDLEFRLALSAEDIISPNIFSANQDGINDCFETTIPADVKLVKYEQWIYDRWGNLMFFSESPDECWYGDYRGQPVRIGVFVYVTKLWVENCVGVEEITKIGDVTVLR